MTGEFNGYCSHYYTTTQLLEEQEERLNKLLNNAPMYTGQTTLNEVDTILKHYRKIELIQTKIEELTEELEKTGQTILMVMQYLDIQPHTVLTGQIPEQVEFEIWADTNDTMYTRKVRDLAPPANENNILRIKICNSRNGNKVEDGTTGTSVTVRKERNRGRKPPR